jgi:hypothetical protein
MALYIELLYCCFTAALLPLYFRFTAALLQAKEAAAAAAANCSLSPRSLSMALYIELLYCRFTAALLQAKEAAAAAAATALSTASSAFGFLKNSVAGTAIGSSILSKGLFSLYSASIKPPLRLYEGSAFSPKVSSASIQPLFSLY